MEIKDRIETRRLLLRAPVAADIPALVRELGRFAVSRWLGRVPHPYVARHARQFLTLHAKARAEGRDMAYVVTLRGRPSLVIGGIGAHGIDRPHPVIGCWLAERHWGKGYTSEALAGLLAALAVIRPRALPMATAMRDNRGSIRVLERCGFERLPGCKWLHCRARGRKVQALQFIHAPPAGDHQPETLATRRLVLVPDDRGGRQRAAPTRDHPADRLLPPEITPAWVNFSCFGPEGEPVGTCGLLFREDGGVEVGYRIAPEHRRRGYALEAMHALIGHAFDGYRLGALEAEVAEDNLPSLALLARLGFADTGRGREQWSQRRQAYITYRMHRIEAAGWRGSPPPGNRRR